MNIPLSETMRPQSLAEVFGQDHLVGKGGYMTRMIREKKAFSLLLWGPPGCGKTTIARLYAKAFSLPFVFCSGSFNSTADIKKILKEQETSPLFSSKIILFVDEIHRFNRAQQDLFLPFLEDGSIVLIGATTENPSFVLNNALLSRLRVLTLNPLKEKSLDEILIRYENISSPLPLTQEARNYLITQAQGDGRHLLNLVENIQGIEGDPLDAAGLAHLLQKKPPIYDQSGDLHYNLISALHKAIRGSDPDAALYWFTRMLEGGEEPLFIARRLIRVASEDVGLADPSALPLTVAAYDTYARLGSPEGELALAQIVIYLSLAPKSNAIYVAYEKAKEIAAETGQLSPPKHILNAPTSLMKEMGFGKGYEYDHDTPQGCSGQAYLPKELQNTSFYIPVERGFEREMKKRLDYFTSLRKK